MMRKVRPPMTAEEVWTPLDEHGLTGVLADVATIMIEAEAGHHDVGWDNSPVVLYRVARDWLGDGPGGYTMQPMAMRSAEDLMALATAIHRHPPRRSLLRPAVAEILVSEGWLGDRKHATPGVHLADVVGSREIRFAVAVIESRHLVHLERVRGNEPKIRHSPVRGHDDTWGGRVIEALRVIQCASRHG